ncbi:Golgi localized protein, HID1-like protein 3, implicated in vesicle-mediated transport [Schizosaccharomyces osmophilus]|uniref:Golgi localized protein, HID1-like protein 3, implicated in vesicle-mediated transport n=1 Tax=Schizosaccharomyces osmophilus TaxID=2545709 RepID=A0AAF0AVJ1_9SCHI|nr:Golgi localized protein, HID1-like protein 3, implicated in vesicle-mediated transport [Schizosaccharomyces osmophilus]WBW72019.1 Golgi localized protein, HID1-like protein 3, implicated in vesicle-mediated transport [Schizosaccharomyces osmophilus]
MGGQESKLAFQRGIARLADDSAIPLDDDVWVSFWNIPESAAEVYSFLNPDLIRRIRELQFENIEKLLLVLTSRLFALKNNKHFPNLESAPANDALNCIRVLTRIIPLLDEQPNLQQWNQKFWWSLRKRKVMSTESSELDLASFTSTFEKELSANDKPDEPFTANPLSSIIRPASNDPTGQEISNHETSNSLDKSYVYEKTLMEELLNTLCNLMFCRGFTLPEESPEQFTYRIWDKGIGTQESASNLPKDILSNRIEVLRLIMVLISKRVYQDEDSNSHTLTYLTYFSNKQFSLIFLYSLINTAINLRSESRKVAYSNLLYNDVNGPLSKLACQILLIFWDYTAPKASTHYFLRRYNLPLDSCVENQYRAYFSRLHLQKDYEFLVDNCCRLLNVQLPITSYLPLSQKPSIHFPELVLLAWQAILYNNRFRAYLTTSSYASDFLVAIQFYALRYRDEPKYSGLVRLCLFIVHYLSSEKVLCERLNKPCFNSQTLLTSLGISIPSSISYAEFIIVSSFHITAVKGSPHSSLSPLILLTLCNISPFLEKLSFSTCTKLMHLFFSLSSPRFLVRNPRNHLLLEYLLQTFANILENKFQENPNFSYSILRLQHKFLSLRSLTLDSALGEERKSSFFLESAKNGEALTEASTTKPENNAASVNSVDSELKDFVFLSSASRTNSSSDLSSKLISLSVPPVLQDVFLHEPRVMSKKLRGKAPEGLSESEMFKRCTSNPFGKDLEATANSWCPTKAWFQSWHSKLEMEAILATISQFTLPVFKKISDESVSTDDAVKFLSESKLKDILPRAPNFRYFLWTNLMNEWFEGFIWFCTLDFDEKGMLGSPNLFTDSKIHRNHGDTMKALDAKSKLNTAEGAMKSIFDKLDGVYSQFSGSSSSANSKYQ